MYGHVIAPAATRYWAENVGALKQLSEAQRRAVVLHYLGELPVGEIARIEHCPEGTVKARLSRGRAALATLLAPQDGEPSHA